MPSLVHLPTAAIPRGAIVRHQDGGPYMLTVGRIGDLTATVHCDGPGGNTMIAQFRTAELVVVLSPPGDGQRVAILSLTYPSGADRVARDRGVS